MSELENILASLAETERNNQLIIENSLDAIIGMDSEGKITQWNPQAERICGWSKAEVLGQKLSDFIIPPQHRQAHENGLKHFLATGTGPVLNKRIEIHALHKQGHQFPVELSISPLKHGETYHFSAFLRDITERKKIQDDLKIAKEAAEAANLAKNDFLANMSHEIRTPMNGIIGTVFLLLQTQLNGEQAEYAVTIKESTEALLLIMNDILDFSRIESGKLELEKISFSLKNFSEMLVKVGQWQAKGKGLRFIPVIDPRLPDQVAGDHIRLRQVLFNLLNNAIKFTEKGEVEVGVKNLGNDAGPKIHFWVRDTGMGIAQEKQEQIFSAFTQIDSSPTRRFGGTGLGLALSSKLVKMMGGELRLRSIAGQGSTFEFILDF